MKKIIGGIVLGCFSFLLFANITSASDFHFVGTSIGEAYGFKEKGLAIGWTTNQISKGSVTCSGLGTVYANDWSSYHRVVFSNMRYNKMYSCTITAQNELSEVATSTLSGGIYTGRMK
jgi:hypothetical protein